MIRIIALCLLAQTAAAQTCPPAPDHADRMAAILYELRVAPTETHARVLTEDLWRLWTDAPDARAQELLDQGMQQRSSYDFLGARDTFDTLVEYCPDYAEGYNQRAFASFLRQDYAAALYDLDRALEINPNHIAALSGKGLTLLGMGRTDDAQDALRAAVALNPWLRERGLLAPEPGTDL